MNTDTCGIFGRRPAMFCSALGMAGEYQELLQNVRCFLYCCWLCRKTVFVPVSVPLAPICACKATFARSDETLYRILSFSRKGFGLLV